MFKRLLVGPLALCCGCSLLLLFVYRMGQKQKINVPTGINKVLLLLLSTRIMCVTCENVDLVDLCIWLVAKILIFFSDMLFV